MLKPGARRLGNRLASWLPQNLVRSVDRMLIMANEPWSLHGFLATWLFVVAAGVSLFAWTISAQGISPTQSLSLLVLMVVFPVVIPYAVLRRRVKKRQKQITLALPNALDLLTTCVEAGLGVDAAFGLVTQQTEGPLSDTFAEYLKQAGLGRSRKDALAYVAGRAGVPDLIELSASINQAEELGTTMGDVLRRQAEDLRALRRQRAQQAAQRAPVLMTIPLALCFLPAMGAVVVVPSILNLLDFVGTLGGG
jgi:tight adherence protein C